MKIIRSSKCHFRHLTKTKKKKILILLVEYSKVVNFFIETFENQIPEKKKFDLILAVEIHKCPFKNLTARLIKNAYQEGYDLVFSTKESCKALEVPYKRPVHAGNTATLSCTIASIDLNPTTKEFDLNVTLECIGNREKISIPLKKHKQFNKWKEEGKLNSSIILRKNYIQFSFDINIPPKKLEGKIIGIDIGIKKLLATSEKEYLGIKIESLIKKLHRKKRCSKAYYRCKEEIKEYICRMTKLLPWKELKLVVVEKLKNLKKNMKIKRRLSKNIRRVISNWNYKFVLKRIQMLSEEYCVSFRSVPPYFTSQICPDCNHRDKRNRVNQDLFKCQNCGYSDNADYVGSKNILDRFLTGPYGACFKTF